MNDLAIGRVFRRLRQRLDWQQQRVATLAGISDTLYSQIERGQFDAVSLRRLRRVAAVLEVDLFVEPRWRGGTLERMLAGRHAAMTETIAARVTALGWEVRPEVSFNHFGERGIVDLVAWHSATSTILLIEIKTELADINGLLGVTDRRRRLATVIGRTCGWEPEAVGQLLVVAESRTNHRRVADHRTLLKATFPGDGRSVAGWLARPRSTLNALWFLPDSAAAGVRRASAPRIRVRAAAPSVEELAHPANFRGRGNLS